MSRGNLGNNHMTANLNLLRADRAIDLLVAAAVLVAAVLPFLCR